jgi:dihydroorotate dehydrogenase (NAD+) catalytic subunit
MSLTIELAGLKLRNPIMLAAGILGSSGSLLKRVAEAGAGAVVTKSIGLKPCKGYPNPTIAEVEGGLVNAMGLPNPGITDFVKEIDIAKEAGVPVITSVYGSSPEEFAKVASMVSKTATDALELNVSCPHVKEVGMIGQSAELVAETVRKVKLVIDKPVFVKLTPNVTDIVEIARSAEGAGADVITAINTLRAMTIDVEVAKPILSNEIGGLSGPAIKPIAIRCVYEISKAVKVPVIGCGGIRKWQDVVEFMLAGASAVQIGTAIFYEGLKVFKELVKGIEAYLAKRAYRSVEQIVGLAHSR